MKKLSFLTAFLLFTLTTTVVQAQVDITTALYYSQLTITNEGAATAGEIVEFPFSGYSLVDQNFISSDGLNSVVVNNLSTQVPSQPPSTRMALESAQREDNSTATFTSYTTEINDATADDVIWWPASPAVDDAFYFGFQSPGRILTINNGIASDYDATVVWEYYDGSSWVSLTNVEDGTEGFTVAGVNQVTWDMPYDWSATTVNSISSYYVRLRISAFTSSTTIGAGTQAFWESGVWITQVDSIGENQQINYLLYLGGSTDLVEYHYMFPGAEGIITPDDASIELGSEYSLSISGYFNTDGTNTGLSYVVKGTAFRLYNPSNETVRLSIDSGAVQLDIAGVTSGYYTISAIGTSSSTTLSVSGPGGEGSISTSPYTVPDNSTDWTWVHGPLVTYVEEVEIIFPIITDWFSSGTLADGGTLTNVSEYNDWSSLAVIGNNPTTMKGYQFLSGDLWGTGVGNLFQLNPADGSTISSCATPGTVNVDGLTHDGTNFWILDTGINGDAVEIDSSCTQISRWDVSSVVNNFGEIIWNGTNLVIFGDAGPTFNVYNTAGTQISSDVITAIQSAGATSIAAAEYVDPFYYVITTTSSGSLISTQLWRMTDHSDAVPVYNLLNPQYGYAGISSSASSFMPIQPGINPFSTNALGFNGSSTWYFSGFNNNNSIVIDDKLFSMTTTEVLESSHIRIYNDWCGTVPDWSGSFSSCAPTTSQRSGLNQNSAYQGTNSYQLSRTSSGIANTSQTITGITEGLAYSFGAQVTCGGEDERMDISWQDSGGGVISTTSANPTCSGAFSDLSLNNQIAPANATQVVITLVHQCGGICGGSDTSVFDCIQVVQNTAREACPTTSTNLVQNFGFESLYDTDLTHLWESSAINLTSITDVGTSSIVWSETLSSDAELLIETSIDGGSEWLEATSGSSIPGIDPGDDLTGLSLLVRGTFTPSTDGTVTPQLNSMQIVVSSSSGDGLQYRLMDIPSLTIEDNVGSNDGSYSFPLPTNSLLTASAGPLTSTGFAEQVGSDVTTPDIVDTINPGDVTTADVFGNDIPLNDLWEALSAMSGGDVPPIMFWVIIACIIILASGSYTFMYTGSVPWTGAVMGMFTLGFINFGGGVLPFWVFFFFAVMAMATATFSKIKAM